LSAQSNGCKLQLFVTASASVNLCLVKEGYSISPWFGQLLNNYNLEESSKDLPRYYVQTPTLVEIARPSTLGNSGLTLSCGPPSLSLSLSLSSSSLSLLLLSLSPSLCLSLSLSLHRTFPYNAATELLATTTNSSSFCFPYLSKIHLHWRRRRRRQVYLHCIACSDPYFSAKQQKEN
jgi:hypothetical protein